MKADEWEKLKDLFEKALALSHDRRRSFVAKASASDAALGKRLEILLANHEKAGTFLEGGPTNQNAPGSVVALRYKLIRALGKGGMGEVYRAKDTLLDRDVVVKFLPQHLQNQPSAVNRFIREAHAASALNHPNIVTIHDAGKTNAGRFIVMEFISGKTVRRLIGRPLPPKTLVRLALQMAKALSAAHAAGIIHRDIKPENIMVRDDDYVKVLDFGLARWESGQAKNGLTATGPNVLLGTLRYLSPEQLKGQPAKKASDIFSLGIVLYELATGKYPFEPSSAAEVLQSIITRAPTPPSRVRSALDPALENLILSMLEKDYNSRPTATEVEHALLTSFESGTESAPLVPVVRKRRRVVGRERERAELQARLKGARFGSGFVVAIGGEPGIGKTTLVLDFLDEVQAAGQDCAIGRGRSSERLAGTEAYLPLLEILEDLLQGDNDRSIAGSMRELAPDWYAQVAPPLSENDGARAGADTKPVSQERLKRQIAVFLKDVSRRKPLIFFFDDFQWADASTVDLLAYLASQFESIHILVLLTYRPGELVLGKHPFVQTKFELQSRNQCSDLVLEFLAREDVAAYLDLEFHGHRFPQNFSQLIHDKSEGNPFLMVDMLRYLRDRKIIVEQRGAWSLTESFSELQLDLPESIKGMIQRKIDFLTDPDRQLLAAASVQGYEFDSAVLAKVLPMDPADVEERLDNLDRVHAFVRLVREQEFPDRTLTLRYRFVHVLYQNALFKSVTPSRKSNWSEAVAKTLLGFYADSSSAIAAQLAALFEVARDSQQAAKYFLLAARHAVDVAAYKEASLLAERALSALEHLPETPERLQLELEAQLSLGGSLLAFQGYGNDEVQRVFARARKLCLQAGENPELFPALWGLYSFYAARLELDSARELAEQLVRLALHAEDSDLNVTARLASGVVKFFAGDVEPAFEDFKQSFSLDNSEQRKLRSRLYGLDTGILCKGFEARVLWFMGYPDQSLRGLQECLKLARDLNHPPTLAFMMAFVALAHQMRGEVAETLEIAEELVAFGKQHGFVLWIAEGSFFKGWVQTQRGQAHEGIETMRQGLVRYCATGTEMLRPYFHAVLAETLGKSKMPNEGIALILDALNFGKTYYDADLRRIQGQLVSMKPHSDAKTAERYNVQAKAHIAKAFQLARRQRAKSFELRAAIALQKLSKPNGDSAEASTTLREIYDFFSEGFSTADLREARKLLGVKTARQTR